MKRKTLIYFVVFCMLLSALPFSAFAVGNDFGDAIAISVGTNYAGAITNNNKDVFYRFEISSSGEVTLSATAYMEYIIYRIYNLNGEEVWSNTPHWNSTTQTISTKETVDLIKGTYYLNASQRYGSTGEYQFNLAFSSSKESFTETISSNNNSMAKASSVSLNSLYIGQIAKNDEVDFYKFTMPSSGRITLTATAYTEYLIYRIYDAEGNELWGLTPHWNSTTETISTKETIDLIKGTYYFVALQRYSSTGNYQFALDFISAEETFTESQSSNNNSMGNASEITFNKTYKGQIAKNDVKDFYRFVLSSASKINLSASIELEYVICNLYDSDGKEIWYDSPHWNSTTQSITLSKSLDLSPGVYYLVFNCRYDSTGNYSFSLSSPTSPTPSPDPIVTPAPVTSTGFKDVKSSSWYADAVQWAVNHTPQITNGTSASTFSPDANCTRAQMVTFLWRAAGEPAPKSAKNPFSDVKSSAYYYKAVLWAVEKGITNGTSATAFSPDATVTRAQTVTFLWRMEGQPRVSISNPFKDVKADQYYTNAVLWAVKNEITNGTSASTFAPDASCTRAQIVTFLYRDLG